MRLWHKDLIPYLPRKQLLGQWRECCAIAKAVKENTLNHVLVNRVKDYPLDHLCTYGILVGQEMERRGINVNPEVFLRYFYWYFDETGETLKDVPIDDLFYGWHNKRYFKQCYYNLQEKFDCGAITIDEWGKIRNKRIEGSIVW